MLTLDFGRILGIGIISFVLPLPAQTPQATLSTNSVYLGLLPIGDFASEDVTLSNTGTSPLIVSSISMTGSAGAVTETNTCGRSLDPGASCVITFSYTPAAPGLEQAYLSIVDNDATQVQQVLAGGVGQGLPQSPVLDLVNVPIRFGDQPVFAHSPAYTITVVNRTASDQAFPASYYDFQTRKNACHAGTPSDLPIVNNCPQVIPSQGTCTLVVQFAPLAPGLRHAANPTQIGAFSGMATSPFPLVIMNALSGKVLDMTGASMQNGSLLQQWSWNGAAQQTWDIGSAAYVNFPLIGGTIVNHLTGKARWTISTHQRQMALRYSSGP